MICEREKELFEEAAERLKELGIDPKAADIEVFRLWKEDKLTDEIREAYLDFKDALRRYEYCVRFAIEFEKLLKEKGLA